MKLSVILRNAILQNVNLVRVVLLNVVLVRVILLNVVVTLKRLRMGRLQPCLQILYD